MPKQKRLPLARSDEACRRLLSCVKRPAYRVCFSLMYGCGLRIAEATGLPISAIDSGRMALQVVGKGNKERLVPLPASLLEPMRDVWRSHQHTTWIFPSRTGEGPMASKSVRQAFRRAREAAGLDDGFTPHVLRHSYATRLVEEGTALSVVQALLGHASIRSTQRYLHVTEPMRRDVRATVDRLFDGLA